LAVSKSKFCLNGTKISGYLRYSKNNAECEDGNENCSTIRDPKIFPAVATSLS
jgi:hypothetical protein